MNEVKRSPSDLNMMSHPTIGVVAISRNEAEDLPGFLVNLLSWVDEIVIVDDASTDHTVEIARAAGSKVSVLQRPMSDEDGFAGQRNAGIAAATSDWLINMDIDERIPPALANEIKQAISDTTLNAFCYARLNFFMHRPMKGGGWCSWNHPQLARRNFHQYINKVHERCEIKGGAEMIGQLENKMWHLNDASYQERMRKSFQYCQMEAEKLLAKGTTIQRYDLLLEPLKMFGKKYIWRQGFKDGTPGLISAVHAACAVFRCYALAWDAQNKILRSNLEQQLEKMWEQSEETMHVS